MNYYIKRGLNEYGPYTLADLQRYVAQGNILMTDLARSEGLNDWVPVSQVIGNIPVPPPVVPGAVSPVGTAAYGVPASVATGPVPPDFHWALVLVIGFFCGIFQLVWLFVEAAYVKKLKPQSDFMGYLIAGTVVLYGGIVVVYGIAFAAAAMSNNGNEPPAILVLIVFLVPLAGAALYLVGVFKMRDAFQEYYNTTENIGLRLSGVMTFFFALFYFQYHFSRIAQWKRTGFLEPQ